MCPLFVRVPGLQMELDEIQHAMSLSDDTVDVERTRFRKDAVRPFTQECCEARCLGR